jgi:SpoVK/Ycf46/Vps4 family AAA+-type ATPase
MSTAAEAIRRLLIAHFKGDETGFHSAALEFLEREKSLNHHVLANELERILAEANGTASQRKEIFTLLTNGHSSLPRDKERNALLIDFIEPKRALEDLVLAPPVRQTLERIVDERRKEEILGSFGIRPTGKVLFCGPPGCGKTVAAEALARELCLPLATVRFDAVISSYLGETAANLRKVFEFGRSRPMVLLFDEFDAIGKHRTSEDEHGELKRVVNSFLQLLDGFHSATLTIAATNHQGMLDPALWRRFDEIVAFPKPTLAEIIQLLTHKFRQFPFEQLGTLERIGPLLEGFSHADVEHVALDATKQTILSGQKTVKLDAVRTAMERQHDRLSITTSGPEDPESRPKKPRSRRK